MKARGSTWVDWCVFATFFPFVGNFILRSDYVLADQSPAPWISLVCDIDSVHSSPPLLCNFLLSGLLGYSLSAFYLFSLNPAWDCVESLASFVRTPCQILARLYILTSLGAFLYALLVSLSFISFHFRQVDFGIWWPKVRLHSYLLLTHCMCLFACSFTPLLEYLVFNSCLPKLTPSLQAQGKWDSKLSACLR